jgi:DNA-directed RNA polymerase subunit omega
LEQIVMNAELVKQALEKVGNPHVLVNIVSRRVRQLNAGGGGISRPLVANTTNLGVADIALREIVEEKIGWVLPELEAVRRPEQRKVRGFRPVAKALRSGSQQLIEAVAA